MAAASVTVAAVRALLTAHRHPCDPDAADRACAVVDALHGDPALGGVAPGEHAVQVLRILLPLSPDADLVLGCLLWRAVCRRAMTLAQVEREFGRSVRAIVAGAHVLSHLTAADRRVSIEHVRTMFLRAAEDARVVPLLLCEQRAMLERLPMFAAADRRRLSRDALGVFAPVAARLGMYGFKHIFEEIAFPVLYPTDAQRIQEQLSALHRRMGGFLPAAAEELEAVLRRGGIPARTEIREKQPYSIFTKMRRKSSTHVEELYDLFALRVIVPEDSLCYPALGVLHRSAHAVPNRFKDFIAFPKPNGYQSLHTTLRGLPGFPAGVFAEVQIRTERMHREAEYGVAAHWSYKEGGSSEHMAQRYLRQAAARLPGMREHDSDHIFVLTPKGDVIEFPEGASPLDFAFHVHTEVGLAFQGARVNGNIVPLDYRLENGDIVEILKRSAPQPSPRWMKLLRTASARARLRRYLLSRDRPMAVARGRELLNAQLGARGMPPLDPDLSFLATFEGKHLSFQEREDLLAHVAHGTVKLPAFFGEPHRTRPRHGAVQDISAVRTVRVDGPPMPTSFARCCRSNVGNGPIVGVVGRDGKVRVHEAECHVLRGVTPSRMVPVSRSAAHPLAAPGTVPER